MPHPYAFELNKDFNFAAAHYIPSDEAGKCSKVHGHTYFVNITVAGNELDNSGFLVNFSHIKKLIHDRLDHSVLNEDKIFSDTDVNAFPSSEIVARTIHEIVQSYLNTLSNVPKCVQVYLRETPTSYVIYRPRPESTI